uniref:Uncharacterized protein n=1 Tax=Rhizophora mucronata TaxID=61149 RepID=A0A2P2P7A0_RHIMU
MGTGLAFHLAKAKFAHKEVFTVA